MGCNLKTTKSLDCALIGVFAVIGSNMVSSIKYNAGFPTEELQGSPFKMVS